MEVHVSLDLSQVGALAKRLEKAEATVLRWRVRQAVADVGKDVLNQARSNASWSRQIPAAINLRTSFGVRSAGVTLKVDRKRAPHAWYYENGSRGSGHRYIKHPVWGSQRDSASAGVRERYDVKSKWATTPTRPFFWPAVRAHGGDLKVRLQQELDAALHELGFHL